MRTKMHKLEFAVFRNPPMALDTRHKVIAAVSGGADSVAMLHMLVRLQRRWAFAIDVVYVHHGDSADEVTARYRNRAARIVEKIAKSLDVPFHALRMLPPAATKSHISEEALREGRFLALENYAAQTKADAIAIGHHFDDLFETRLIRLMRGTGPQGITAMKVLSKTASGLTLLRPLLKTSRSEIETYLADLKLQKGRDWLQDPSNADERYLRNSIRKRLIPMIERTRNGGVAAMSRSLELLADFVESNLESNLESETPESSELDRAGLLRLNAIGRRAALSKWVASLGVRGFSKAHCDEMLKRIDTRQKRLSFKLCGRVWLVGTTVRLAPKAAQNAN